MGHLTKEKIQELVLKVKDEINENKYCEIWSKLNSEEGLHYCTDDIMRICMNLTTTGKYQRIEPINDDSFVVVKVKMKMEDWPKKYWLAGALIAAGFAVLTPIIQKKIEQEISPPSSQQEQKPANSTRSDQKTNDSPFVDTPETKTPPKK